MIGKNPSFMAHITLAIIIAYGLSVYFWLGLGVFNLIGFIGVSALAVVIGLAAGWLMGKRLWVTALATLAARLILYAVMMRGL